MGMTHREAGDVAAIGGALGVYFQMLPEIAAVLAIIWTLIRIYEWARVRILKKPQDFKWK